MNTQTGGRGETIQSAPEVTPTSEQFTADIPPIQQEAVETDVETAPPAVPAPLPTTEQPVAEQVTEPVVPEENPNKDNILFQTEAPDTEEFIVSDEESAPVIGPQTEWDFTFGKNLENIPSATD